MSTNKSKVKTKNKETQTEPETAITQNIFILPPATAEYDEAEDPEYFPPPEEEEEEYNRLKRGYSRDDNTYYENLSKKKRQKIDRSEEEIDKVDFTRVPMRFRILDSNIDIRLKQMAIQKLDELGMMFPGSGEYFKLKNWVENLCKLPIGKYKNMPVSKRDSIEKINRFMERTKDKFDSMVYGHSEAKTQIIQLLAKLISNPSANGIVIGIQGPMGTGKTTLGNALCEVLDLPFGFVSLAGINGEPIFRGHSFTYEGSRWGKIADILMKSEYMNPVLYFDELDKISTSHHGEEVANFLVHLTDFTQNSKFQDHFFGDIDLDLSKCIFVFSYNHEQNVNPILRDRMVTIKTKGYTLKDKVKLADEYMLPKILKEYGFSKQEIVFDKEVLEYIIARVEDEQGARNMKRGLEEIIGTINYRKIIGTMKTFPVTIDKKIVDELIIINKRKEDNTSKNMMYL